MYYEIDDHEVLSVEEVTTPVQIAIVKKHFCPLHRVNVISPKNAITVNEALQITFQWQKFNIETGTYENDPTNNQPILVQVNDLAPEELTPVDGSDYIAFSSAEPGKYAIRAINPGVSRDVLEVTVSA